MIHHDFNATRFQVIAQSTQRTHTQQHRETRFRFSFTTKGSADIQMKMANFQAPHRVKQGKRRNLTNPYLPLPSIFSVYIITYNMHRVPLGMRGPGNTLYRWVKKRGQRTRKIWNFRRGKIAGFVEEGVDRRETLPLQKQRDSQNQTRKEKGIPPPLTIRWVRNTSPGIYISNSNITNRVASPLLTLGHPLLSLWPRLTALRLTWAVTMRPLVPSKQHLPRGVKNLRLKLQLPSSPSWSFLE